MSDIQLFLVLGAICLTSGLFIIMKYYGINKNSTNAKGDTNWTAIYAGLALHGMLAHSANGYQERANEVLVRKAWALAKLMIKEKEECAE